MTCEVIAVDRDGGDSIHRDPFLYLEEECMKKVLGIDASPGIFLACSMMASAQVPAMNLGASSGDGVVITPVVE